MDRLKRNCKRDLCKREDSEYSSKINLMKKEKKLLMM